jgi:putative FmdB family regulatory protein
MSPVYQYYCPKCGKDVEVVKPMAESKKDEKCPDCDCVMRRGFQVSVIQPNGNPEKGWTDAKK